MRAVFATAVAAGAVVATAMTGLPAQASSSSTKVVSSEFAAPFNIAVAGGHLLVADGFIGGVFSLDRQGVRPVVTDAPGSSGVAVSRGRKLMAYTTTVGGEEGITAATLEVRGKHHSATADTLAFEQANNPDQGNRYGLTDPTPCQSKTLAAAGFPVSESGAVDSHPYSVTAWGKGWVVADAGSNGLLYVDNRGKMRSLAVLPPQPSTFTADAAEAFGLDECVVGETYNFEPVPTDVEVGPRGMLYVTTLPGGPEDALLGARGSVYRVNPWTGRSKRIATGFLGATNLALGPDKAMYVAELFRGGLAVLRPGARRSFIELPGAVSVESSRHSLWAGTVDLSGESPGTIVRVSRHHSR